MALTKKQKQNIVSKVEEKLSRQKSVVFTDFAGLNVSKLTQLRKNLRKKNIDYIAIKKTLLDIALKKAGFEKIDKSLFNEKSCALAIGYEDELSPANTIYGFAKKKENEIMNILGGIFENKFITKEEVIKLAKIPSRETILTQLAAMLNSPARNFAMAIKAIAKSKA